MPTADNPNKASDQRIQLVIQSRLDAVPLLARLVEAVCQSAGISPSDRDLIGLCIVEAVNNSILHAYHEDPGQTVHVEVRIYKEKIIFELTDRGESADPVTMNADHRSVFGGEIISEAAESGRGLAIMQEVMDSVEYSTSPGSNRLRLVKSFQNQNV
jgi:anti-sigma regulatory factor (Ser/Thr protein kinase)